jgi:hypothetical protein
LSPAALTDHGRVEGRRYSVPIIQLEPNADLPELLFRTRRQTISWYMLSKPVVAAGALAAMILAVSLWFAIGSSSSSPVHHPRAGLTHPNVPRIAPSGFVSPPDQPRYRNSFPSRTTVAPPPTTSLRFAFTARVDCPAPVTLNITGTGTGSNTLRVTGPTPARAASGDQIALSVTGPAGTYTITDTDRSGHPGIFWASHGSSCYGDQ